MRYHRASIFRIISVISMMIWSISSSGQDIIRIGPPETFPGNDLSNLQQAINNNPDCVLLLSAGKYRLGYGDNSLVIPHGITIQGQADASGQPLTTIVGSNFVFQINATGADANDNITLRNLNIVSSRYTAVSHTARNRTNQNIPFVTGGGNVLIERCLIEAANECYQAADVDGVSITIKDSRLIGKTNAISVLNSSYTYLTVTNNQITSGWTGCLLLNLPWNSILTSSRIAGPANISNNRINSTLEPDQWGASIRVCIPAGKVWIRNNVLKVEGGFGAAIAWHNDAAANFESYISENTIIGSEEAEFKYVTGMEFGPFASLEYSGNKVKVFRNSFHGYFQTGVLVYANSRDNVFVDNDFSDSLIKRGRNTFSAPSAHWAMVEYDGLVPENNTVMDNLGTEQTYVDCGIINDFKGTAFQSVSDIDHINRPNFPI